MATTSAPQSTACLAIGRVHAQDELGPRRDGERDLARVEAIDGDAEPPVAERPHGVADLVPGCPRVAAEVDHVGPFADEPLGLGDELFASRAEARD